MRANSEHIHPNGTEGVGYYLCVILQICLIRMASKAMVCRYRTKTTK